MAEPTKSTFELVLSDEVHAPLKKELSRTVQVQNHSFYLQNAVWFCQVRWLVVLFFSLYGIYSLVPGLFDILNLKRDLIWPFTIAGILATANAAFFIHMKTLEIENLSGSIKINVWSQIIFDLFIITIVIYKTGSIETYVPFFYLFHIVIACIFFSRTKSFIVTIACVLLYVFCVGLETSGQFSGVSLYTNSRLQVILQDSPNTVFVNVITSIFIWVTVWFLTSKISVMLKEREINLSESNFRLEQSQQERMDHMIRTTHELKAPFAAIHANTQLLLRGYCGALSNKALEVMNKISIRSRRLTNGINLMLQLANLRSAAEMPQEKKKHNLVKILNYSTNQVNQIASEYKINLHHTLKLAMVSGVKDHLKMVFINLLSNAIFYSHKGGDIFIECGKTSDGKSFVTIEDNGIGIPSNKLPKIFDEYYRTEEAAKHNKNSTGLGLAIVRHVAITHNIKISVESAHNSGTKFILVFQ